MNEGERTIVVDNRFRMQEEPLKTRILIRIEQNFLKAFFNIPMQR